MSEPTELDLAHTQIDQPRWKQWANHFRPNALPIGLGVLSLLLTVALVWSWQQEPVAPLTNEDVDQLVAEAMASATPPPATSALVYQMILPSIAVIQTEGANDDFGMGTGVIINQDGLILTNLHVVQHAQQITVNFADGTQTSAVIDTAQPENDIAVLVPHQLPGQFLPAIIGGGVNIGDEVYAVGNPLGLVGSMSAGIVSGLERSFVPPNGDAELSGMIQFDAAVNPGNSGGPLLNRAGQVVGIVTGLVNPTQSEVFIGIGFAVPIGTAASAAGGPQQ